MEKAERGCVRLFYLRRFSTVINCSPSFGTESGLSRCQQVAELAKDRAFAAADLYLRHPQHVRHLLLGAAAEIAQFDEGAGAVGEGGLHLLQSEAIGDGFFGSGDGKVDLVAVGIVVRSGE